MLETLPSIAKSNHTANVLAAIFEDLTPNTLRSYSKSFSDFGEFMGCSTPAETAEKFFTMKEGEANFMMLEYKNHLSIRLATASVASHLSAIGSIVKRCRILGIVPWQLTMRRPKIKRKRETRGPGAEAVATIISRLRQVTGENRARAIRNIAIIQLLFNPALRRFEVIDLDLADVDQAGLRLYVRSKGDSDESWVTIAADPTMKAIVDWIAVRGEEPGPLFTALDSSRANAGHRLSGEALRLLAKKLGDAIGARVRPHALRHTGITTALIATGKDLVATSIFARHQNIKTTMIYLDNLNDQAGDTARKLAAMTLA